MDENNQAPFTPMAQPLEGVMTPMQTPVQPEIAPILQQAAAIPVAPAVPTTSMGYPQPTVPIGPASQYALKDPAAQQAMSNYLNPPAENSAPILSADALANASKSDAEAMTRPTLEQIQSEYLKMAAPYQQERARLNAMDAVDKMRLDAEKRQLDRETALAAKMSEIDARVRSKSFGEIFSTGSTGQKIGAALSILAGGVSQGLTGAKSNPVVDFMDRLTEQQAAKDKLSLEEKQVLQKQVYQQAEMELKKVENATQNAFRKDQLALMQQELGMKQKEIEAKIKATVASSMPSDIYSGRELTKDELLAVRANKDLARTVVTLPNGKSFLASNATDSAEFKKFATESFNALNLLEQYRKLGTKGSTFSLKDRAQANTLKQVITGALRLPLTGPGALTDPERQDLFKAIGDPLAFTSIRPVEISKLDRLVDSLKASTINKARLSGVSGSIFDEKMYKVGDKVYNADKLVQEYQKRMPSLSEEQIRRAISKQFPEL